MATRVTLTCIGLAFGIALMLLSFCAAGFGHGTYVLLGLSSSPLGALPLENSLFFVALLGTPILWGLIWLLVALLPDMTAGAILVVVMGLHYVTALFLLSGESFGDWSYIPKVRDVFTLGSGLYCAGQVTLWVVILRRTIWRPMQQIQRANSEQPQSRAAPLSLTADDGPPRLAEHGLPETSRSPIPDRPGSDRPYASILVPSTSRNFRIHSGWPGQAAAVTRLPSTTALENVSLTSHHVAPARTRSGLTAG